MSNKRVSGVGVFSRLFLCIRQVCGALRRGSELIVLSHCCALWLRLAWVPMTTGSGLAPTIYRPIATLLTAASSFVAMAACIKVRRCCMCDTVHANKPLVAITACETQGVGSPVHGCTYTYAEWVMLIGGTNKLVWFRSSKT